MTIARQPNRRPRVLHLAFTCGPNRGSEPGVGWHRAVQAARFCDTWVITRKQDCKQWIDEHFANVGPVPGLHFVFLPLTSTEHRLSEVAGLKHLAQLSWQPRALILAQRYHKKLHFDLTHKTSYCGYREPSYLWRLDAPFVWGPIGGTQNYPWRLLAGAGPSAAVREGLRSTLNSAQLRTSRRIMHAARRASAVLAANSEVAEHFRSAAGIQPEIVSDVGVERIPGRLRDVRSDVRPLRIVWAGVCRARKALELLIDALSLLPSAMECEVRVLGEGPMRSKWQQRARRKGVEHRIRWMGPLPHEETLQQFNWADVMAFTSLRDTTGTVIVEALAAGAPVIGIDHQGCRDVVTSRCGLHVPLASRRVMSLALAEQIMRLAREPQLLNQLSRGALEEAQRYLWSEHGIRMAKIYNRVLERDGADCRCDISSSIDGSDEYLLHGHRHSDAIDREPLTTLGPHQ